MCMYIIHITDMYYDVCHTKVSTCHLTIIETALRIFNAFHS